MLAARWGMALGLSLLVAAIVGLPAGFAAEEPKVDDRGKVIEGAKPTENAKPKAATTTKAGERAVAAALNWLSRHQSPDGSWSLDKYSKLCKDKSCAGPGGHVSDVAGTSLGLLPLLAAGQTHKSRGPYQQTIYKGLYWLMKQQKPDGGLMGPASSGMYSHGLATLVLCEAYGMTDDKALAARAQQAVRFIEAAQHPRTGGWRYQPGEEGDLSVVGWQMQALYSAKQAGLAVKPETLEKARRFIQSCSAGPAGGQFSYQPGGGATGTMTAVGADCLFFLGDRPTDPALVESVKVLGGQLPELNRRNLYYWYYATMVMHRVGGSDWDQWNRALRKSLIESQVKEGCAAGSWDPAGDNWGLQGGRLYVTSLSALTLEVYYRYLPLFQPPNEEKKN